MPPPGDIVKAVRQTATTVVDTAVATVTNAAGQSKKPPASSPDRDPVVRHAAQAPSVPAPAARTAATTSHVSWSLPAGAMLGDAALPGLPSGFGVPSARTPVVAPASRTASTATQVRASAPSSADVAERGNSVMRGVLIALAAASAATLAFAHVTAVRGSRLSAR
ncbi:MAG: hypothetical protein QOD07_599 [Frankiaceae bacterium]|nr:hypothetical protein [Frankiaceae bacterium]